MTKTPSPRGPGKTPTAPVERASTLLMPSAADVYRTDVTVYGRHGLLVHDELKAAFCALEGGVACGLTPSGLSAVTTALLSQVKAGDHVLITDSAYAPTRSFAATTLPRYGVEAEFYDPRVGADIAALIRPNTAVIHLESPGSLTFEIQDLPAISMIAKELGVTTTIDATWMGGVGATPIALGADVVIHAATKFPSGGSDVFLGAIVSADAARGAAVASTIRQLGLAVSPDDAYAVRKSMRTLDMRYHAQDESARAIAQWLETRPEVTRVIHPALPSHPDHALWTRDFTAAGALFAFNVRPTSTDRLHAFFDALNVFGLGFSFGGFESLALHCDPQLKRTAGPSGDEGPLIRLAIGLEPEAELRADLDQALSQLTGTFV